MLSFRWRRIRRVRTDFLGRIDRGLTRLTLACFADDTVDLFPFDFPCLLPSLALYAYATNHRINSAFSQSLLAPHVDVQREPAHGNRFLPRLKRRPRGRCVALSGLSTGLRFISERPRIAGASGRIKPISAPGVVDDCARNRLCQAAP